MRRAVVALSVVSLAACGDLQHENPFDPATPPDLQAKTTLSGAVTLEPVNGVTPSLAGIQVSLAGTSHSATTDAAGAYDITGVPPGSYTLQAVLLNYETATVSGVTATLDTGGTTVDVPTLAMKRVRADLAGTVALKLPDDTLEQTGGATVSIDGGGAAPPAGLVAFPRALAPTALSATAGTALTDEQGAYVIPNVAAPLGSYTLTASRYGYVSETTTVTFQDGAFVVQTLQLVIDPGALVGTVLVVGGDDSAGVVVRARGTTLGGTPWEDAIPTDAAGTFRLSGLPAGTYNVTYELADHATVSTTAAVAPGLDTSLPPAEMVRETGSVYGVATLEGMGDHSGIQVSVTPPGTVLDPNPLPVAAALTDANGNWRMDQLPAGITYTVKYERTPGFLSQTAYVDVVPRSARNAGTVQLAAIPGRLSGTVSFEGAVAGALDGTTVRLEGTTLSTLSLASGAWEIAGVAGGGYTLLFERAGYETARVQLVLGPGADLAVAAVALVRARGAVVGTIVLSGASNSAGVVVTASGGGFTSSTVTAQDGAFSLQGLPVLPSGSYTVTARKDPEWQPSSTTGVTVAPNGTTTLTGSPVTLAPIATASIAGRALLEGASDHSGTTATLSGTDFRGVPVPAGTTASTAADGSWSFASLRAGSYQVSFSRSGFESPAPVSASVLSAQAVDAGSVTLPISRGSIAGTFLLSGAASSAGVVVTASGPTTASTVTNASGAFSLSGLAVGTYSVTARLDPDWSPSTTTGLVVARNATTPLTGSPVTLAPVATASIAGRALLEGASDHSGTTATLSGTDFRGVPVPAGTTASTAADGSWSFASLRAGSYQVAFSRSGFESPMPGGVSIGTGQAIDLGAVTLPLSRGSLGGQFQLAGATSSAGVVVTLQGTSFSTVTDAAGTFDFGAVPIGTYTVVAAKPDWQGASLPGVAVARYAATLLPGSPVALQPVATASIAGVALLELRADASGTFVTLSGTDFRGVAVPPGTTTATDAAGGWSFEDLVAGSYQVSFSRADFDPPAPVGVSVVTAQAASVGTLTLAASRGAVGGTVTAQGAASHAGTVVEIAGGPDSATAVTDAAGKWSVSGLRVATTYTATYRRTGYVTPAAASFPVAAGATTAVGTANLLVATTAAISGVATVVRPTDAASSAGILVSLSGADLNGASVTSSTNTISGGAYSLTGLPQGTYNLAFSKTDYAAASAPAIVTQAGGVTTAQPVALSVATGSVTGAVKLSAGAVTGFTPETNLSGIVVSLTEAGVEVVPPAVTDTAGRYAFDGVPAAVSGVPYVVTAQKPYYLANTGSVAPSAGTTNPVGDITLTVDAASLSGFAWKFDNLQHDDTVNADSSNVRVDVSGTAFNGTPFSRTVYTATNGAWSVAQIPAGTWTAVATSAGRACAAIPTVVAGAGAAASAASVRCSDAGAPTAPLLATPAGTDAQVGYTRLTSIGVPVTADAVDAVNLRGYQAVKGATPDWTGATVVAVPPTPTIAFSSLAANATNVLWVRAVDWVGNAGPAASVTVVQDGLATALTTSIETPRATVDATTTSVTLRGAEADPNFLTYQACGWSQAATASCPASCTCPASGPCTCTGAGGSCTLDATKATPSAFALSLTADERTCLLARAVDKAGNAGTVAIAAITSDLTPPSPAIFAPTYDPTLVTVHADYVDFFLQSAATDAPAGGGTAWKGIAYLEVDTGGGYTPLCPAAACHPNDTYDPCAPACACTDSRLLCSGASFLGVRMQLLGGVVNDFQARGVDVAGNRGAGLSQQVVTAGSGEIVQATTAWDLGPRPLGDLLVVSSNVENRIYELGPDQRLDPEDRLASCAVGRANGGGTYPAAQAASQELVAFLDAGLNKVYARRVGPSGFCQPGYTDTVIRNATVSLHMLSASGERVAWTERTVASPAEYKHFVQEPGTDGKLGGPGSPAPTVMGTFGSLPTIQLQGSALLEYGNHGGSNTWKVWNAVGGAFSPDDASVPARSFTFPTTVAAAGLSSDGKVLATFSTTGGVMSIRRPDASGHFGAGDAVVSHTFAAQSVTSGTTVAVEGSHAVAFDSSTPNHLYHWYAGADATFGTLDDTFAKLLPFATSRVFPALGTGLANGQLYFQVGRPNLSAEDPDVWSLDLGAFRWETPLTSSFTKIITNGSGTLFFNPASGGLACRTGDGRQTTTPSAYSTGDADGADLVVGTGTSIFHFGPDADGLWFTSGALPSTTIYTAATSSSPVAVSAGRAIIRGAGTPATVLVLEPGTGTLRAGVTAVRIDTLAGSAPNTYGIALAGPHAFYGCADGGALRACYHYAGANGVFGDGDDVATAFLKNPSGVLYYGVQSIRANGRRLIFSPSYGQVVVLDPGPDGVFNTGDEVEWNLGSITTTSEDYDLGGDVVAWIDTLEGEGRQVFGMDLATGTQRQLTHHYSNKSKVAVDSTGRVWWQDFVFAQPIVFVSTP